MPFLYASGLTGLKDAEPVLWILLAFFLFYNIRLMLANRALKRTKKAVERLPIQCGVFDAKGRILFYQVSGESKTYVAPKTIHDLSIELQQEFEKVLPTVFSSMERQTIEFDSYSARYKVDLTPLPKADYGVPAVLWVVHNVTELTDAFAERTRMVHLLRNTLRSIGDAVVSTNYDGEITLINPSAAQMAGMSETELLGKKFDDCFRLRGKGGESLIQKVILHRESYPFHSILPVNEQDMRIVDGLIAPIVEDQLIVGTVLYFRDTTELTRQGQRLQQALKFAQTSDRAKSDFLATVNYEFRSSVNIILGYCELSRIDERGAQDPNIENIRREADMLLLMFNDILDVSKSDMDTLEIKPAPVNFKELVREMQRIFGATSRNKKIPLVVRMAAETPVILSDYKALRQILMRLLSQVYSLAGHDSVLLAIDWIDQNIVIEISINAQKIQVRQDRNLSIFKRLCERLNGELNVRQTPDRLALEVVLRGPKVVEEAPTAVLPDISDEKGRPRKNVVLLVDDIEVNLKVLAIMLKKLGIESVPCTTARAALEEIERYTPLAVFTDLWMPDVGGEELAMILSHNPETAVIPRILITADTELDKNFENLFQAILHKPLLPQALQKVWTEIEKLNSGQKAESE